MSGTKKEFQDLTIIDNFLFAAVMEDPKNSKRFLEMLFGLPIDRVEIKNSREWGDRYMGLQELLDEEYEDGLEKGKAIGLNQGKKEHLVSQVKKKLAKGNSPEEIAEILEEDISVIKEIVAEINAE